MKYLLALGFLGTAMGQTYVQVISGTCENSGYETITDFTECGNAAAAYVFNNYPDSPNGEWKGIVDDGSYPSGCIPLPNTEDYYDQYGASPYVYFNVNDNNNVCNNNPHRVCLCRDSGCPEDGILKIDSNDDAKSLTSATAYCSAQGMQVCTYASICQDGELNAPKLGTNPLDSWVVTIDNDWVQTSDAYPGRLCRTHKQYKIATGSETESTYVRSPWMDDESQQTYKREVYCCTAEYNSCTAGGAASTCDDASALNNGAEGACEYFAELTYEQKKAKLAELVKPGKKADSEYGDGVKGSTEYNNARSEARVAAKQARRNQIKEGITSANWKNMTIVDADFEGYTDNVLEKRGVRDIHYRFVPKGDTGEQTIELDVGTSLGVASTDPLESFDLDLDTCLEIDMKDSGVSIGNIKVCKDEFGELSVACDNGAFVGKIAGDAVQCLGYEWDVGSLTVDGSCVQNAEVDADGDCVCKSGYAASDTDSDGVADACVADPCATDIAADYINAQCCQC